MALYYPVLKKYWKQHELWDGTYTITDLLDIWEAMSIKSMTEQIFLEYEEEKFRMESSLPYM